MSNLSALITQTVGSSSGGVNLITAPSSASIWTATGGVTVATTTTAAELPLEGFSATAVKFSLSGSSGTAYCDFDCPTALQNFLLGLQWFSRSSSAFTAAITLTINSYTSGANRTANTSPTVVTPQTSSIVGAGVNFDTNFTSTTNQYLRLTLSFGAQAAAWYSLAQFSIGPGNRTQGAAVSDPVTYTPIAVGFGTPTLEGSWTRNGSDMIIQGKITSGVSTAVAASFSIPTGYTVGSSPRLPTVGVVGTANNPNATMVTVIATPGGTTLQFSTGTLTAINGSTLLSAGQISSFFARIPIAEWAGNGTVNLGAGAQVEYVFNTSTNTTTSDSVSFAAGPQGALIGSITATIARRVQFQYPIQSGDSIVVEVSDDRIVWMETPLAFINNQQVTPYIVENSTGYGIGLDHISTTQADVYFGQYAGMFGKTTVGGAGQAWSVAAGAAYWRVRKAKASSPVGFGTSSLTERGINTSLYHYHINDDNSSGLTAQAEASFYNVVVPYTAIYTVTCTMQVYTSTSAGSVSSGLLPIKTGSATYASATYRSRGLSAQTSAVGGNRGICPTISTWTGQLNAGDTVHYGLNMSDLIGTGGHSQHFFTVQEVRRV